MSYIKTICKEGIKLCYFAENNENVSFRKTSKKNFRRALAEKFPC